jgi:hypothetical protein
MYSSVLKFTVALNYALLFWKLSVLEFRLGMSESCMFNVCFHGLNYPFARCASAAVFIGT